ncbi:MULTISPECIES: hypothetical protein [Nocardioides]|uniref:Uncharacterized protein n=1 Tax=Nocardioides abyssi TaxID=3058370 RepID=A0ABT8EUP5_9ACTN|nr:MULTISPECIES: hypothetical protein [Nocardioides]MDN4161902.1 hypothetical protein [Nocardioides abyssi]WKN46623.1 hypothetical protein OSR43_11230 [Nocardioides sp. Arc9.136]
MTALLHRPEVARALAPTALHLGPLHPVEVAATLGLAFGQFLALGAFAVLRRPSGDNGNDSDDDSGAGAGPALAPSGNRATEEPGQASQSRTDP